MVSVCKNSLRDLMEGWGWTGVGSANSMFRALARRAFPVWWFSLLASVCPIRARVNACRAETC